MATNYVAEYYDQKYAQGNASYENAKSYIKNVLDTGEQVGNYNIKTEENKIVVYKGTEKVVSGTLKENGEIDWKQTVGFTIKVKFNVERNDYRGRIYI